MLVGLTAAASAAVPPRLWRGRHRDRHLHGKDKVDDTHEILVFLFDHPTPTAEHAPRLQVTTKSGGTVTFKDVAQARLHHARL